MKIDEFKMAIRALVRNEVKRALKEEVKPMVMEEVNRAMSKVLVEMVKEIKVGNSKQPVITEEQRRAEEIRENLQTKNPKLSRALAETAKMARPMQKRTHNLSVSLTDLMEEKFEKINDEGELVTETVKPKAEPKSNMDFLKQMVSESVTPQVHSVLDTPSQVPDVLKGVFKKDFRAVMKKMDEFKKSGTMGLVAPGTVSISE